MSVNFYDHMTGNYVSLLKEKSSRFKFGKSILSSFSNAFKEIFKFLRFLNVNFLKVVI